MSEIVLQIAASGATIIAAIIAAISASKARRQTARNEELNREQQQRLEKLNYVLSLAAQQAQERYSMRAQVLVDACRLAGEVCYYLERFLTPYTAHQPIPREEFIEKAEATFEALMKFRWENSLFLWHNERLSTSLNDMMGAINKMRNAKLNAGDVPRDQAKQFLDTVTPALHVIREEFNEELRRVEA